MTPNWFAAVMGTGILSIAAAGLPVRVAGLGGFATVTWIAAGVVLVVLIANWVTHRRRLLAALRQHAASQTMAPFFGAPAMALVTVGTATLLVGPPLLGPALAQAVDWGLWSAGTAAGLLVAVAIPYLMITRHDLKLSDALGTWMMPVVPPMVSAASGALLIPHLATRPERLDMLLFCYALFGVSGLAALLMLSMLWSRLILHKTPSAVTVPTLWIVLGPLGQSITAINLLGRASTSALPAGQAEQLRVIGLLYGTAVWGFAMLWLALAAVITIGAARDHLPFTLTWWSFTFPVGTVVTGTTALYRFTAAPALRWIAAGLYLLLVVAWLITAARTIAGVWSGQLFVQSPIAKPVPSRAPQLTTDTLHYPGMPHPVGRGI